MVDHRDDPSVSDDLVGAGRSPWTVLDRLVRMLSSPGPAPADPGPPTLHYRDSQVDIHEVVVGPMANNVFVVRCRATGEALLVDAANEHDRLLDLCRALGVGQVVETHGHWDHVQAVPAVREAGLRVAVTAADAGMLPSYDDLLEDESVVQVGRLRLATIATPGHTPGSMCFAIEGSPVLLSGDTLFPGGPGNTATDLGDFPTILASIERRLFSPLPPDTIVMPGHGADTTIGAERPHLQEWADRGW
ncbi:MAG: MBL fold metallo-hydrolase [Acidimicrobiales bacterium]